MFPSNSQFLVPDNIKLILNDFYQKFLQSFSYEIAEQNHTALQNIENDNRSPFCLLEIIKETIVDGNNTFQQHLIIMTGYLAHLIEDREIFNKFYNGNPDYANNLYSSILYLLPYAALIFQNNNLIDYFNHLFSCFINLSCYLKKNISDIFNQYVTFLLNNPSCTIHQQIIAMLLASKVQYYLTPQNIALVSQNINFFLSKLPICNFENQIEVIIYKTIFQNLNTFFSVCLKNKTILIEQVLIPFLQHFEKFMNTNNQQSINENSFKFQNEVEFLNNFIDFFFKCFKAHENNSVFPNDTVKDIIFKTNEIFYRHAKDLIISSQFYCSQSLISFFVLNNTYFLKEYSDNELSYFMNLIIQFLFLTSNEINEIFESEEHFFYDIYEIDFEEKQMFSTRQILAQFLYEIIYKSPTKTLFMHLIAYLASIQENQIQEHHFYLLSILILIAFEIQIKEQQVLTNLHILALKYIQIGSAMIIKLIQTKCIDNINYIVLILSIYFMMNSSIFILQPEEIKALNYHVRYLILLIQNLNNSNRIFFTFFCIFINNLIDFNQLLFPQDQILQFVTDKCELCFTNHAILLSSKFAIQTQNVESLLKSFYFYMDHNQNLIKEFVKPCDSSTTVDVPIEISTTKEYNYSMRYFKDSITKMSNIIRALDFNLFDQKKLHNFVFTLIIIGDDWPFSSESVELMSAILSKAPNATDWAKSYLDSIFKMNRNQYYGEWTVPLIHLLTSQPDLIQPDIFNSIIMILKEHITFLCKNNQRPFLDTWDSLMLLTLIARILEYGFCKINVSPADVKFFSDFAQNSKPTEEEARISTDLYVKDHELCANILQLAAILASPNESHEIINPFLIYLYGNGEIVTDEMRYMTIIIIDRLINPEVRNQFLQIRQLCFTNQNQKNKEFTDLYNAAGEYFVSNVPHPIFKLYQIEGFVFDAIE